MLRKAIDLWSREVLDRQHVSYPNGENLKPRLERIAAANPMYAGTLAGVIDFIRGAGNGVLHDPESCAIWGGEPPGRRAGGLFAHAPTELFSLIERVEKLVAVTVPEVEVRYAPSTPPEPSGVV